MIEKNKKQKVGILNWWWNSNRGAILTCYAIYELVKEFGYNPVVIKHIPYDYYNTEYKNSISEKFAEKYLKTTKWCHSRIDMRTLNDEIDTFMVGSDMVWNYKLNWFLQDFYYLNFAKIEKNLISCAASFGFPNFVGNSIIQKRVEYYLKRFNSISVREKEGVDLLKNTFGVDGTFILDPVFLIDPARYQDLTNKSEKKDTNYLAYYFVNKKNLREQMAIVDQVAEKLKVKAIDIKAENSVEDWLYYIQHAKFIISDSFHCSAFSTIFNKPFLTIRRDEIFDKDTRLKTLVDVTGTGHRFIKNSQFSINEIEKFLQADNFEAIQERIRPEKERSLAWLKNAIENPALKKITKEQEIVEAFYTSLDDRINHLECKCYELDSLKSRLEYLELIKNKGNILRNYYKYKILKFIIKKEKYKQKANIYHEMVRKIRKG